MNRLDEILKEQGRTGLWLSRKTGMTEASISRIRNNMREMSTASAIKIADALGISIDYLVGQTDVPQTPDELFDENEELKDEIEELERTVAALEQELEDMTPSRFR